VRATVTPDVGHEVWPIAPLRAVIDDGGGSGLLLVQRLWLYGEDSPAAAEGLWARYNAREDELHWLAPVPDVGGVAWLDCLDLDRTLARRLAPGERLTVTYEGERGK
jgi:hypothetical protein